MPQQWTLDELRDAAKAKEIGASSKLMQESPMTTRRVSNRSIGSGPRSNHRYSFARALCLSAPTCSTPPSREVKTLSSRSGLLTASS